MIETRTFPDWYTKREALRHWLATREPCHDHHGRLRLATGAIVGPEALAPKLFARNTLLWIASDAFPEMLLDLANAPLDEFCAFWDVRGGPPEADPDDSNGMTSAIVIAFATALFDERGPTRAWVRRWRLPGHFDPPAGADSDALMRHVARECWGIGTAIYSLMFWRAYPLPVSGVEPLVDAYSIQVGLDPDLGLRSPLVLPETSWDPQRETRMDAHARILGELRQAVRRELDHIEADALTRVGPAPTLRIRLEHLAWLARYHFGHESYAEIAHSVGLTRQSVTEAVKAAAHLIDLPLRPPSPPGPKRATTPAYIVRLKRIHS